MIRGRPKSCDLLAAAAVLLAPLGAFAQSTVPVYCVRGAAPDTESNFTCTRADTRASFTTVPAGLFLHLTNLHATSNDDDPPGGFSAQIGRDAGGEVPTWPGVALKGVGARSSALLFETPQIVLRPGEALTLQNYSQSDVAIAVYASGFLAPSVRVPEPAAALLALASIGALRLLDQIPRGDTP